MSPGPVQDAPGVLATEVRADDIEAIRRITESTGFFSAREVDVALELAADRLQRGSASDYRFIIARQGDAPVAYACYGPIACTEASFDLYWLVVEKRCQNAGWGRRLLREAEEQTRAEGGLRLYVETSNRVQYAPTRAFYERCGYRVAAVLEDFYAPGDAKVIYLKLLA